MSSHSDSSVVRPGDVDLLENSSSKIANSMMHALTLLLSLAAATMELPVGAYSRRVRDYLCFASHKKRASADTAQCDKRNKQDKHLLKQNEQARSLLRKYRKGQKGKVFTAFLLCFGLATSALFHEHDGLPVKVIGGVESDAAMRNDFITTHPYLANNTYADMRQFEADLASGAPCGETAIFGELE